MCIRWWTLYILLSRSDTCSSPVSVIYPSLTPNTFIEHIQYKIALLKRKDGEKIHRLRKKAHYSILQSKHSFLSSYKKSISKKSPLLFLGFVRLGIKQCWCKKKERLHKIGNKYCMRSLSYWLTVIHTDPFKENKKEHLV